MIPLRDENPAHSVPVVTRALIAVNLAAFCFELSLGRDLPAFLGGLGLVPARLSASLAGSLPWSATVPTVFSAMFLHGGWVHVLGNMWYLWIFGDNIEDRLGRLRFAVFYLSAGVLSALVHVLMRPDSPVPVIGASGAVAGVLGAYAIRFPRARVVTFVPILFFFQIVALPALLVLGLWFVVQFFSGTLSLVGGGGPAAAGTPGGVAWWAHIAGFVFGFVSLRAFEPRRPRSEARIEEHRGD